MAGLAEQLDLNHKQAAITQQALRNNRRVLRHGGAEAEPDDNESHRVIRKKLNHSIVVAPVAQFPVSEAHTLPIAQTHTAITVSPLDLPTEQFSAGLDRRKQNRQLLMDWLRTALVESSDFGRIHVASRDRCQFARTGRMKDCPDPNHWSKPSLFKPGAEKITGMLGMTVHYPSLPAYEAAVLSSLDIKTILMRCELRDAQGRVAAEGVGARNLAQDYGDLNKSLKMAEKSAHIDATLRLAGLSEVFTQDLEDRPVIDVEESEPKPEPEPVARKNNVTRSSRKAAPPVTPPKSNPETKDEDDATDELVDRKDVAAVRKRIADYGFTEKRVLAWLYKTTQGTVTTLEQLSIQHCTALLKKLDQWAEAESQADGQGDNHE